jgi:acyl-CoA hydrolase
MEIGARVEAENSYTGDTRHILSAFFTFVALDDNDRPVDVPEVIPETDEQRRRFKNAQIRREGRLETRRQLSSADGSSSD